MNGIQIADLIFAIAVALAITSGILFATAKVKARRRLAENIADIAATAHIAAMRPEDDGGPSTDLIPVIMSDTPEPGTAILEIQKTARITAVLPPTGTVKVRTPPPQPHRLPSLAIETGKDWTPADTDAWIARMKYEMELFTLSLTGGESAATGYDGKHIPVGGTWIA